MYVCVSVCVHSMCAYVCVLLWYVQLSYLEIWPVAAARAFNLVCYLQLSVPLCRLSTLSLVVSVVVCLPVCVYVCLSV